MHRTLISSTPSATAKQASRRLLSLPSSISLPTSRSSVFTRVCNHQTNNTTFNTTTMYLRSRPHTTYTSTSKSRIPRQQHTVAKQQQQRQRQQNKSTLAMTSNGSSSSSSSSSTGNSSSPQHAHAHANPNALTRQQIQSVFLSAAIPMVGFGFMDNFVMITAGSAIDNSLGVQLGLATMTAAAIGQVVSDVSGVVFGDTLSRFFKISAAHLTAAQRKLAMVRRLRLAGAVVGVIVGCTLGATALYLIPDRVKENNNNNSGAIEKAASSNSSSSQNQQARIREQLYRLQKVLNDVMTNKEDKWCDRRASCTLYVNDSMSNSIPSSSSRRQFFGAQKTIIGDETETATIDRLRDAKTKGDSAAIQAANEARVVVFADTIYVPVVADNNNNSNIKNDNILGVLKVQLENGSFYSGSEIQDTKRVARNLGFFMNHMM